MRRSNTPSGQGRQLSKGMTRCVMSDDAFRVSAFHPFLRVRSLESAFEPLRTFRSSVTPALRSAGDRP